MDKFDAIVVFGGGILENGQLKEDSVVRTELAIKKYQAGVAPTILFCGKWSFSLPYIPKKTEAAGMTDYAVKRGVPTNAILREEKSTDTLGNAYFAKVDFVLPRRWQRILIIVADYHAERAGHICRRVFAKSVHFTVESAELHLPADEKRRLQKRQIASQGVLDDLSKSVPDGDDQAIWNIMNSLHPGYAVHPKYSREDLLNMIARKERALFPKK